jgi:lipoprotein NlpI
MSYLTPRVANVVLSIAGCLLAFLFARRWYGPAVGLVLAGLLSGYWVLIYFDGELHAPPLLILLLWIVAYCAARWTERVSWRTGLVAGLSLGLASLVRPNVPLLAVPVLAWGLWVAARRRQGRGFVGAAVALFAGVVAAITPATIRNYRVSGEFVPISSNGGINLYIGNNPNATGAFRARLEGLGDFRNCFDLPGLIEKLEQRQGRALSASEMSAYFRDEALRWIREHPGEFLRVTARKARLFWHPQEIPHNKQIRCERMNSIVLRTLPGNFWLLLGSALAGIVWLVLERRPATTQAADSEQAIRARWEVTVLLLALILTFYVSIVPFFVTARYRVPIIPFTMLLSAYGLCGAVRRALSRRRRLVGFVAIAGIAGATALGRWEPLSATERFRWHYVRGKLLTRVGEFERAAEELAQAALLNETHVDVRMDLGGALARLGHMAEAAEQFRAALRIEPDRPELHVNLGLALLHQKRLDEAAAEFEHALQLDPLHVDAHVNLGAVLLERQRYEEAAEHFRTALQIEPTHEQARRGLAECERQAEKTRNGG